MVVNMFHQRDGFVVRFVLCPSFGVGVNDVTKEWVQRYAGSLLCC